MRLPRLNWKYVLRLACCLLASGGLGGGLTLHGQEAAPAFSSRYNLRDLGAVPAVPGRYGALTFKAGAADTLLIGGNGNTPEAKIYEVTVARRADGHITGFSGNARFFAHAHGPIDGGIDGGLAYGPDNVLFFTSYPDNAIGQIKPGETNASKYFFADASLIRGTVGTLAFVPAGMPGAGHLKILTVDSGNWYDATLSPDASGTFDINIVSSEIATGLSAEGALFVPAGNPLFSTPSVLVADYSANRFVALEVDAGGDPVLASLREFATAIPGAEGATQDPVTGDFLFSSLQEGKIYAMGGFQVERPSVAITSPLDGETFVAGVGIPYTITATQPGGVVTKVEVFLGAGLIDVVTRPPFQGAFAITNRGNFTLRAVAYGNGLSTTSAVVNLFISSADNDPPNVVLREPLDGAAGLECSVFALRATAFDNDGFVTKVQFFRDGTNLIASATEAPFSASEIELAVGTNFLTAIAIDDRNARSISSATRVTVRPLPVHQFGARLTSANTVALCFRGEIGASYVFEKTPSLTPPAAWTPFATNTAPAANNGLLTWIESRPTAARTFLRARKE